VNRRAVIGGLGSTAMGWPLAIWAQQPTLPVIGILESGSPEPLRQPLAAFVRSLSDGGFVEGKTVALDIRWAEGQYDRLPAMAAELVNRNVAVIAALGGTVAAIAAKSATNKIPIVFAGVSDPVASGLVSSLNRPVGNVTGATVFSATLETKKLELLREMVPKAKTFGALVNPINPTTQTFSRDLQEAARGIGLQLTTFSSSTPSEIDSSFAVLVQQRIEALVIMADPLFTSRIDQLAGLVSRHAIPTIYQYGFAAAGGLMSYGTSLIESMQQAGIYTVKVLKGEKPGDLPVVQPTKFEFVVNLRTAKTLGIDVPAMVLATADQVIE
jgi:putative ABC transport system substrate-binding protein